MPKQNMKIRIKRAAQFLFDNAGLIRRFLRESNNYRVVRIEFSVFKHQSPELQITLEVYDEGTTHKNLAEQYILTKEFTHIQRVINQEIGIIECATPIEVRDKLEVNHVQKESQEEG